MEDKWYWMFGVIVLIFIVGAFTQKSYGLFSVLPTGEYSAPSDCSFITNTNPYTSRYTSYNNAGAWIAIDTNNDGTKERYGRRSSGTTTGSHGNLLIEDYNSYGDDIYKNLDGSQIRVVNGQSFTSFEKDYGAASNAIISCTTSCTENWQCESWSSCVDEIQTKTCTDLNNCGTVIDRPPISQSCAITQTCLLTDTNNNGIVDRNELGIVIQAWVGSY